MKRLVLPSLLMIMAMALASVLPGCQTQRPADQIMERGDHLYSRGEYAAAADEYEIVAQRYPGSWQAQYRLGLALTELGRYDEARRALEIAQARRRTDPEVADALAEVMFRQGDTENLFIFLRDQADRRGTVRDYLRLGHYAAEMGDPDTALTAIEFAIEIDAGESVDPYLAAADLAERVGDRQAALRRLCQAYGIDPNDRLVSERIRGFGEVPGPTLALPPGL